MEASINTHYLFSLRIISFLTNILISKPLALIHSNQSFQFNRTTKELTADLNGYLCVSNSHRRDSDLFLGTIIPLGRSVLRRIFLRRRWTDLSGGYSVKP